MISQFTNSLKLNVGSELQVDEMEYSRRKYHNKRGVDRNWFIDSIDTELVLAFKFDRHRKQQERFSNS